ncbi:AAA domain-containing protein [Archangium lansingense]|uniref:AAA domain-containing protein n=1 Tax=Archangium lansingense TaxID=2995310 RepID=A0ABT4AQA8_9BACT|nr:AAA domain-containing protein [Archangium lansinium]MCY1083019.1 AAA domain-containing protein [Archangium lansinium]
MPPEARNRLGGEPTPSQEQALHVALNTPDIALIQGPPGTGKTSVIAALMERLAQTSNEPESISGSVLLTSFQHEAVENAAARTVVFGLPAVKQGRRRGRAEGLDNVETWRKERIEALESSLVQEPGSTTLKRIRLLVTAHLAQPGTVERTAGVLREVADLGRELLPGSLLDRLRLRATRLARGTTRPDGEDAEEREYLLLAIRGLRVEAVSFLDDGALKAAKVLRLLTERALGEATERDLLTRAAAWTQEVAPPFLPELSRLRETLLQRLAPDARPRAPPLHGHGDGRAPQGSPRGRAAHRRRHPPGCRKRHRRVPRRPLP